MEHTYAKNYFFLSEPKIQRGIPYSYLLNLATRQVTLRELEWPNL